MSASSESKGTALVTGAAQGIGRAIALRLADDGYDVAVNDVPSKKAELDGVSQEITAKNRRTLSILSDVSVEDEVKSMIETVVKEFGGLDVMIANAGILRMGTITDSKTEDWDALFSVNARGIYLCYKYAAKQMIAQGRGGRIIGASSAAGAPFVAAYSASKFAVRGLTQATALELGRHGITVNCYAPGTIDTPMVRGIHAAAPNLDTEVQQTMNSSAIGGLGQPEEVASLVSFLVSKDGRFISGQSLSVDGGLMLS
ncbi:NAD(P)-binding protein [Leucogyrophana mollusca]|uniref:NAD(P)-binding protein n=1 Tax=Leucogyrophana mollusca TaxID=85980 RepID=A0ACB8BIB6_9AGAM|nr:NAD(P)-binding protein [Leucogyrophana mollusca]